MCDFPYFMHHSFNCGTSVILVVQKHSAFFVKQRNLLTLAWPVADTSTSVVQVRHCRLGLGQNFRNANFKTSDELLYWFVLSAFKYDENTPTHILES